MYLSTGLIFLFDFLTVAGHAVSNLPLKSWKQGTLKAGEKATIGVWNCKDSSLSGSSGRKGEVRTSNKEEPFTPPDR